MSHSIPELLVVSVWRATWQASVLAMIVLLFQWMVGRRLGARGRYALWMLVLARFLLPVMPQSRLSIFNLPNWSAEQGQKMASLPNHTPLPEAMILSNENYAAQALLPRITPSFQVDRELILQMISLVWLAGICVLSVRVLRACIGLSRLLRGLTPASDPELRATIRSSAEAVGAWAPDRVLTGEGIHVPALLGVWRPALLLPARVLRECDSSQIRLIVMHELAHLQRRDVLVNWLITAATITHWFNPIAWLIAARMRADRELACDEQVLALDSTTCSAQAYGLTLLKLMEILSGSASVSAAPRQLVGILESSHPMQRRMNMIAKFRPGSPNRWIWVGVIFIALGCTMMTDAVRGQGRPAPAAATRPASDARASNTTNKSNAQNANNTSEIAVTEAALEAVLQRVMPEIRFDAVPLADVVDFLRDVSGANVYVNWRALDAAGIDRQAKVSTNLRNVTMQNALEHILHDVGGGTVRLDYGIDNGAIVISTAEDIAGQSQMVFYDVRDLMVDPDGKPLAGEEHDRKMERLTAVIRNSIDADSWNSAGGVGSIEVFNNKLVVRTSTKIQRQIAQLLSQLRERPTTRPAMDAMALP